MQIDDINYNEHPTETEIARYLPKSIVKEKLILKDVQFLDRVMQIYFSFKNTKRSEENEVIEFLFQYLDYHGSEGSILFRNIKKKHQKKKVMKRLRENYQGLFDIDLFNNDNNNNYSYNNNTNSNNLYSHKSIKRNKAIKYFLYSLLIIIPLICFFMYKCICSYNTNHIKQLKNYFYNSIQNYENDRMKQKDNIIFHLYYHIFIYIEFFIIFITAYDNLAHDKNLAMLFILSEILMDIFGEYTNKYLSIMFVLSYIAYAAIFIAIMESGCNSKIEMILIAVISNAKFILFSRSEIKLILCFTEYILFTFETILFIYKKNKCDICYYFFETFLFAIRFDFLYSSFSIYALGCLLLFLSIYFDFNDKEPKLNYFLSIVCAICPVLTILLNYLKLEMNDYCICVLILFAAEVIVFACSCKRKDNEIKYFVVVFILEIIIFLLSLNSIFITIVLALITLSILSYKDFDLIINLFTLSKIIFLGFDCIHKYNLVS